MKYCPACEQNFSDRQLRYCPTDGHLLSLPDPNHLVGRTLMEKYRIDALMSSGGMGAIYSAHHLEFDRRVAIKILLPHLALNNARMAEFFKREAMIASRLKHENIVSTLDAGRTPEGLLYIVMDWLEGHTLDDELLQKGKLSLDRTATILRQVAAALTHAHEHKIIHRDLKPANIMITTREDGREVVMVVDFGIAKFIPEAASAPVSVQVGTPYYASPEQYVQGGPIDHRADIFSLGVVLFQMLSGKYPYGPNPYREPRLKSPDAAPRIRDFRADVPAGIEQLILSMITWNPDDRPESANKVAAKFDSICESVKERAAGAADDLQVKTVPEPHAQTIPQGKASDTAQNANKPIRKETMVVPIPIPPPIDWTKKHVPENKSRRRWGLIVALGLLSLLVLWGGSRFLRPILRQVVIHTPPASPSPSQAPVVTMPILSYWMEITSADCQPLRRSTGEEPLESGQSFRLHFTPDENGYLYLIGPNQKDVNQTFLTSMPAPASGVRTNFIQKGTDFSFPAGSENCFGMTEKGRTIALIAIFSTRRLSTPAFLDQPAGHELNASEQYQLNNWLKSDAIATEESTPDPNGQSSLITCKQAAGDTARPVFFYVTVKHL
jgi:serine/threonine protein kinase